MFDLWDFINDYIIPIFFVIILIIAMIALSLVIYCGFKDIQRIDNYSHIQNLEEKLNIYERSYEEFCLEDSIRQVE